MECKLRDRSATSEGRLETAPIASITAGTTLGGIPNTREMRHTRVVGSSKEKARCKLHQHRLTALPSHRGHFSCIRSLFNVNDQDERRFPLYQYRMQAFRFCPATETITELVPRERRIPSPYPRPTPFGQRQRHSLTEIGLGCIATH
jgi:hypothetical protein